LVRPGAGPGTACRLSCPGGVARVNIANLVCIPLVVQSEGKNRSGIDGPRLIAPWVVDPFSGDLLSEAAAMTAL